MDIANDAPPLFSLGDTTVTWTASDDSGNATAVTQTVTVEDTTPPDLEISVSPTALWPPNHKFVTIEVTVAATDVCEGVPAVRLVSITSDEPPDGLGDGHTDPDIQGAAFGTDDRSFLLRAERSGRRDGRVYTITYEAEDGSGNVTQAEATVTVAKSQKKK